VIILGILAVLSALLNLWQWVAAQLFPLRKKERTGEYPPVTLLKPLKGEDSHTRECLTSWFELDYPRPIQLLFGVASSNDPVCSTVADLISRYPQHDAKLIICNPVLGPNAKVSSLCYLSRAARHETLVISDADVKVDPGFLKELIPPLCASETGLVNCFYALSGARNLPMKWEALAVNADFWSQVLQGISLKPMDFALGAVMATKRLALEKIGGFESLLDYLADDYQLGNKIARSGFKLRLCRTPVECKNDTQSWREVWNHQLRWARTIRVCQPIPYFFSILSNATFWPVLWLARFPSPLTAGFLAIALILRCITAATNYSKLYKKEGEPNPFWLAPFKDLLQVVIWALSLAGNKITWRGQLFRVSAGGKLTF
jgi:ceramide glucosyltransferase